MVKVSGGNNVKRFGPVIKPESVTIRSILQENDLDDSGRTVWALNGATLAASDFDSTLGELAVGSTATLRAVTKADNA